MQRLLRKRRIRFRQKCETLQHSRAGLEGTDHCSGLRIRPAVEARACGQLRLRAVVFPVDTPTWKVWAIAALLRPPELNLSLSNTSFSFPVGLESTRCRAHLRQTRWTHSRPSCRSFPKSQRCRCCRATQCRSYRLRCSRRTRRSTSRAHSRQTRWTAFKIVVPFISQIATLPLLSCHRMSLLPSPLKSPVPTIVQVPGNIRDERSRRIQDSRAVHFPNRDVAAGVTPQNVALAVAVVVAVSEHRPGAGNIRDERSRLHSRRSCRSSPKSQHCRWCHATECRSCRRR